MWVIISSLTIIGYIPWMIVLLNQLKQVRKSYWIPEITWQSILSCVIFVFEKYWLFVIYIFALLLSFIDLKKRSQQKKMIIAALMIILWTAFVGIVLSKLFRPIFIPRYLVPSMACLWFGISAILSIQKKEFIKMIIVCIMLLLTFQNIYLFLRKERAMKIESNQLEKMISKIDTNDSKIITTTSENCRVLSVKIKGKSYLWKKENSKLSQNVYTNILRIENIEEIKNWIRSGKSCYLIVGKGENQGIREINDQGIVTNKIGNERLEYEIYKMVNISN